MTSSIIENIKARQVWDSRGHPTVEVDIMLSGDVMGRAIAPAGASRGTREALDLRDGGARTSGKGVRKALQNIETSIAPALIGMDVRDQARIDAELNALDGTQLKSNLGGNAMIATSLAVLHAAAAQARLPLWKYTSEVMEQRPSIPLPEIQIFGGGAHAGRRVDIQDFMVMVPGADSFSEALEVTERVYRAAGEIIAERFGGSVGVADEGGWWPVFESNEQALECLTEAIERAGETPGDRVVISLDIAASEFYQNGHYTLALENRTLDSGELIEMLARWIKSYPIASIEDPLSESDHAGMAAFTAQFGESVQIIGDDYLVTNEQLVRDAAAAGACNSVLIKINQAGTMSEAFGALSAAREVGFETIVSARSGETEDTSISHLSIGLGAEQLKVGSFTRSERMAKWNEVLRIAEKIGSGNFVGGAPLRKTWWKREKESAA